MKPDTYREHLNDLQLEVEELRAQLKEAQTGDLISRAAAIDALDGISWMHIEGKHEFCDGDWLKVDEAEEALKQLPSAQPEQRWIPVSERLPELNKEVLATDEDGFLYIAQLDLSRYTGNTYWEETTEYVSIEVVAWQPLPEPYAERRRRTDDC